MRRRARDGLAGFSAKTWSSYPAALLLAVAIVARATPGLASEPTGGTIEVSASDGALVYVDGTFVGQAPLTTELSHGHHEIAVFDEGHVTQRRRLSLERGEAIEIAVDLAPTGQRVASSALLAAGSAGLLAGIALGIVALTQDSPPYHFGGNGGVEPEADTYRMAATGAAAAGIALFAGGGLLFVFDAPALPDGSATPRASLGTVFAGVF